MKIYIGTQSMLKINAVESVLSKLLPDKEFKIFPYKVNKHFPITPIGKETYIHAKKRCEALLSLYRTNGDYFIGLESGLICRYGKLYEECWCIIYEKNGTSYCGYSSGLALPTNMVKQIKAGTPHSKVISEYKTKVGLWGNETWGAYTNGRILRAVSIQEAFRNAFAQTLAPLD